MSDFKNVEGAWINFDHVEMVWIKALEDPMTKQIDFYIYAGDIDDSDEYELFNEIFDSLQSAETFLEKFMGN